MRSRHLRGLELGLLAVGMAVLAVLLALPRPVLPNGPLPMPIVNRRVEGLERAADRARAERALVQGLPYEVRLVGEYVRRFGAREARGDAHGAERARKDAFDLWRKTQKGVGAEAFRVLRALQTELFIRALSSGDPALRRELDELGGGFVERGKRAGWLDARGRPLLSDVELWALYRMRWTHVVGALEDAELRPGLAEIRAYYRVLLTHPEGESPRDRDERRLSYAETLGRRDRQFPKDFVRGMVLYRLGDAALAGDAFSAHLALHPDGPWTLRAQNHLLALLAESEPME